MGLYDIPPAGLKKKIIPAVFFTFLTTLTGIVLFYFIVPTPDYNHTEYSKVVLDKDGNFLRVFLTANEQWHLPPTEHISVPYKLRTAVLQFEDKYFYQHPGVNPVSLLRSVSENLRHGYRTSGASTITMQLVRILTPRARTIPNKLIEIVQALKLELLLSKEQIFQLYLANAPYGGNIIGVRTASHKYFGKAPDLLTWAEAVTLAILPNDPGRLAPHMDSGSFFRKRNRLLTLLSQKGFLSATELESSLQEPLPNGTIAFPNTAPHFARWVSEFEQNPVRSTIDSNLHLQIGELLGFHTAYLHSIGIPNAAVLVLETQSGKMRSYHGSHDFFDHNYNGQVDGLQALRSPGSLLKPFLYALAMDEGILLPDTLVKDIPVQFGAFAPQNATKEFTGLVSASEALTRSLNVPAALLLLDYGVDFFYQFLLDAGITSLFRPPMDYGIPLILGGVEISPVEIAALFRGLGMYGSFSPLTAIEEDEPEQSTRLISPGAAYLTLEILKDLFRPGSEQYWESFQGKKTISWKTGTSYGQRDAWAVGVSPEWTVLVWTGNFVGEENPNLSSTYSAGPLLFDIFALLPSTNESPNEWFEPPFEELTYISVCQDSGYRATGDCEHVLTVQRPINAPPLPPCPYHKSIFVTNDEQYQVNSQCWEPGNYKKVSRLIFPPDIAQFLRDRGMYVESLPPFAEGCSPSVEGMALLYPDPGARIFLPRDLDGEVQKLAVRAGHNRSNAVIYWYVDGLYKGMSEKNHAKAFELLSGEHTIKLVDDLGAEISSSFFVSINE